MPAVCYSVPVPSTSGDADAVAPVAGTVMVCALACDSCLRAVFRAPEKQVYQPSLAIRRGRPFIHPVSPSARVTALATTLDTLSHLGYTHMPAKRPCRMPSIPRTSAMVTAVTAKLGREAT